MALIPPPLRTQPRGPATAHLIRPQHHRRIARLLLPGLLALCAGPASPAQPPPPAPAPPPASQATAPAPVAAASPATPGLMLGADFRLRNTPDLPAPATAAGLRFEAHERPEDNAVEWQARLRAPPDASSRLHEGLKSADFVVQFPSVSPVTLHWSRGSHAEVTDFQPETRRLEPAETARLESFGGRSSDGALPYFNLAAEGGGLVIAIGWPGDWQASFEPSGGGRVRVTAGLKRCRFRLAPGEEVPLPSILLMAYQGDWIEGQNRFRRLMRRHYTPARTRSLDLMPVAASVHGMIGFNDTTEANLTSLARHLATLNLPLDTFWLDAGWNQGGFPAGQGNPVPDPARFPAGLAPVGEAARAAGLRFLVWFEPERVMRGTWLEREHPLWLLRPSGSPPALQYQERDGFHLLDLGQPPARAWALGEVSRMIASAGIAIYRQDFNAYPAYFWQNGESAEEQGLREVRYVRGLYEFLDALARRHPGLVIDNCASGGRRLDFEMMRRCVVLWRSDSCWGEKGFPRNVQSMTHGLSLWLPWHGLGAAGTDTPALRSGMGACGSFAINYRDPRAVSALRQHLDRYLPVRALYAADYYPLTPWSSDPARWLAFQFHDPERDEGLAQAFCGPSASTPSVTLRLKGLSPTRVYAVTDWDAASGPVRRTGADLTAHGIELSSKADSNQAVVLQYRAEPHSTAAPAPAGQPGAAVHRD